MWRTQGTRYQWEVDHSGLYYLMLETLTDSGGDIFYDLLCLKVFIFSCNYEINRNY